MGKTKKTIGIQQNLLHPDTDLQAIIEYLCGESNKLHNCTTYYARQIWFKTRKFSTGFDLVNAMNSNPHFRAMASEISVQTCLAVGESISGFIELLKKFNQGELDHKPKFPNYRKSGLHVISFPKRSLKLVDNKIRLPLGLQVKAWFGIKEFFVPMPSNLEFAELKEIRVVPRNRCFYVEYVYPEEAINTTVNHSNVLGVDHGIDNWITAISNVGTGFIVDGKELKAKNQWYNKSVARLMEGKPNGYWSNRLAKITEKRNRIMRDAVNKAARLVINHCLDNQIGTIVFGWNVGQKNEANLGAKTNQNFVQIPTSRLKDRLAQLCRLYGIQFVVTEESYSSKSSFVDNDFLPEIGAKPEGWEASGKRIKRGLYRTAKGWLINADANGSANIIRKVSTMLNIDLAGVSRGSLTMPLRVPLWT